ncbi:uncharacterized protein LOC111717857 [Eurytemora carolleeae]|uniref:uncharacterized protein LOC111717857 n=1 Tax=Eurytemora carolleeae TaxID=1294199 RepID=UPI000C7835D3|nr:uncharacterized protein LOC111717857 [Eurytemora carolleeae]|eukprot:XP_023349080.1 uncharacterized protein LOC111717857 [Eurytemora affinis]
MSGKSCQVCSTVAESSCTGCFAVFYCSQEHQKMDWSKHKVNCSKPYTVIQDSVAGRVMVASRNLEIGDIILKEKAALVGPNTDSGSKPICLGCSASVEKEYCLCSICCAPLCQPACQTSALHAEECKILKQNPDALYCAIKHGAVIKRKKSPSNANYQIILVLRALLLKRIDVKKFKSVIGLQSHLEEREEMGTTKGVHEKIIRVLQQYKLQGRT